MIRTESISHCLVNGFTVLLSQCPKFRSLEFYKPSLFHGNLPHNTSITTFNIMPTIVPTTHFKQNTSFSSILHHLTFYQVHIVLTRINSLRLKKICYCNYYFVIITGSSNKFPCMLSTKSIKRFMVSS